MGIITDWEAAGEIQRRFPHTYHAMQQLVMDMKAYQSNKGKTTWFGNDKGATHYAKFESSLTETLLGLYLDGLVPRHAPAEVYHRHLCSILVMFSEAFPNWQSAYNFAEEHFGDKADLAIKQIATLLNVTKYESR